MKQRGGKREGAGRPEINDRLIQIPISLRESVIENNGGKKNVKAILQQLANKTII